MKNYASAGSEGGGGGNFSLTTSGSTEIQDEFRSERINTIKYVLTIPEMVRRMTNFHSKYLHKFTNVYFGNKSDSRAAEPRGELAWASTLLVGSGCCGGCTSHSNIFNWLTISFLFFRCSFVFSFFRSIVPSVSFSPAFFLQDVLESRSEKILQKTTKFEDRRELVRKSMKPILGLPSRRQSTAHEIPVSSYLRGESEQSNKQTNQPDV